MASGIAKMCITELIMAVWPWLLTTLVFLGMVPHIPAISLAFPRWLGHGALIGPAVSQAGLAAVRTEPATQAVCSSSGSAQVHFSPISDDR